MVVQAVCVVAKGRRAGGTVFGMRALAVDEMLMGKGLATQMLGEVKKELAIVAGGRFRLVADLASCMGKGGAGFYAKQGWTGGEGIWMWGRRAEEWTEWREQQWDRRASESLGRHQEEAVEEAVKGGVAPACYEQGTRTPDGEGSAAEGTDGRSGEYGTRSADGEYGTRQCAGGAG